MLRFAQPLTIPFDKPGAQVVMKRILIIASDPNVQAAFSNQLASSGVVIATASSVQEARQELEKGAPGFLLADLDGLAEDFLPVYQWWNTQGQTSLTYQLFVSGRDSRESELVRSLLHEYPQQVLFKPLKRATFREKIDQGLAHLRADEEATAAEGPHLTTPSMAHWIGRQVGSVILQKEIGRGGMGAVFLGFQSTLNRKVAVKMILPELVNNTTMMARFQREALAMAQLKSPHVVQVYDAGYTSEGIFYMLMEFLEGKDLEALIRSVGRLSTAEALDVAEQVAEGLLVAHNAGITHRDIKPSNLIMSPTGHTTVTDFGLAQQHSSLRFTREGAMLGTPYYFAPEQAAGGEVDARSDIYSLGIVLFELLVGRVPFPARNLTEVLYHHAHTKMPDPREFIPGIPGLVVKLLYKMSAKAPEKRFQDAGSLLQTTRRVRRKLGLADETASGDEVISVPGGRTVVAPPSLELSLAPQPSRAPFFTGSRSLSLSHTGTTLPVDPARSLGSFVMSASGSLSSQSGQYADGWNQSLQILLAVVQQLESTSGMGLLHYALCEGKQESLVLAMEGQEVEGVFFAIGDLPSTMRMSLSHEVQPASAMAASINDPLTQLASTAGVEGLMLMSQDGVLHHAQMPDGTSLELRASQIAPSVALLNSLHLPLKGVDCCFEKGRTLLWRVGPQVLVIWATHKLNKSLLAILIRQYQDSLLSFAPGVGGVSGLSGLSGSGGGSGLSGNAFLPTGSISQSAGVFAPQGHSVSLDLSDSSLPGSIPAGDPADYIPVAEVKALIKVFARYIGPMAKVLLKQELKKQGYSSKTIPIKKRKSIVDRLASRLETNKKYKFVEEAYELLKL